MGNKKPPSLAGGTPAILLDATSQGASAPWVLDFKPPAMLVDQPMVGMFLVQGGSFVWCNEAYSAYFGYTPEELIGEDISKVCTPESLPMAREWHNLRERGEAHTMHYLIEGRDRWGQPVFLENQGTRVFYEGRPAVAAVLVNITERVLRERELKKATQRLRALTRHTNDARERQRAQVARELHDVLGGILTSLKMDVSRLARRQDSPELRDLAESIMALAQEGIDEVHRISRDLRPAILDHLGLDAAVADVLGRFETRYSIATHFESCVIPASLDGLRAASIFRIFQELLTNIARHAGATRVGVSVSIEGGLLSLCVTDNGRGIRNEEIDSPEAFGIMGMRERAAQLHGELRFEVRGGTGTSCTLIVPLDPPKERR